MAKRLTIAAYGVVVVLALGTPAHAQSKRAAGPARYRVPESVAGVLVRFVGTYHNGDSTQYTYGTDRQPAATMQAPRTGTWYIVGTGLALQGRSVVRALAEEHVAGWRGHLGSAAAAQTFVTTNGRICLAMSGADTTHVAIVVVVGLPGRDCQPAQARARRVALFVRSRA